MFNCFQAFFCLLEILQLFIYFLRFWLFCTHCHLFMCEIRFLNGFQRSNSILFFVVLQFYLLIMWKKNSMVSKHHLNFHVPNLLWIVKLEWQEFARNNLKVSHFCCSVQELCDFKFLYHVYICWLIFFSQSFISISLLCLFTFKLFLI